MARRKRSDLYVPGEIAIVHVMNRTNRGVFLFGEDPISKRNCDYRKEWMEQRLQLQASCFGIDLLGYSILSNHFHQVLRSRPDIVADWSDQEVARRWLTLCPVARDEMGIALDPTDDDIAKLCRETKKLEEIRIRLSDISWWMRLYNQMIAQWVNREDETVGGLWQGRFKAVRLLDEASLVACMVYVDLNQIRASIVKTLEESRYSSAYHRVVNARNTIAEVGVTKESEASVGSGTSEDEEFRADQQTTADIPRTRVARGIKCPMHCCLAPVQLRESSREGSSPAGSNDLRCSDKGFLDMADFEYLGLLDWTARQLRGETKGVTPSHLAPLFERLGLTPEGWLNLVRRFRHLFGAMAGLPAAVDAYGQGKDQKKFRLPRQTHEIFSTTTQGVS